MESIKFSSKTLEKIQLLGGWERCKKEYQKDCNFFKKSGFSDYISQKLKKCLSEENLEVVNKNEIRSTSLENRIPLQRQKEIISRYVNGETIKDLSNEIGCSLNGLKNFLKRQGIHLRDSYEYHALLPQNQRKYQCKDNFFKELNPDSAWLLGFLAADGYVSKGRIFIALSSIDIEILEKIKQLVQIESPIKTYSTKDGFEYCRLEWTSHEMLKDLSYYGIVERKTFLFNFPTQLPKNLWIHFIRGYFDGDGSVNILQGKALRWQICGARKEVLETMVNFLFDEYAIPKVRVYYDKNKGTHGIYYFQYSTNATKTIFDILYKDTTFYLKRKYEKYQQILDIYHKRENEQINNNNKEEMPNNG